MNPALQDFTVGEVFIVKGVMFKVVALTRRGLAVRRVLPPGQVVTAGGSRFGKSEAPTRRSKEFAEAWTK